MTSDDDQRVEPPKKPGFLRRLFGGGQAEPVAPEPVAPEPVAPEPVAPEPVAPEPVVPDPVVPEPVLPEPLAPPDAAGTGADTSARAADAAPAAVAPVIPEPVATQPAVPEPAAPAFTEPPRSLASLDIFAPLPDEEPDAATRPSWWSRLKQGLSRSSSSIGQGIADVFTKRKLDATTLEELDDILIRADLGVATAARITEAVAKDRYDKAIDPEEVKEILAREIESVLTPLATPLAIDASRTPFTILVIGVNGSGKTTTIGKLAAKFSRGGRSVMLAAGDTFRAAAVEQLKIWGERTKTPVLVREQGADAAGLAFDAYKQARDAGTQVLLIDTAGRLQNRTELMDELAKIIRVLRKIDAEAPHAVLLVLDATVGQNAMSQVEIFGRVAGVTGLVMTKLDGTARGGILVAIADRFRLPIHFIGVGEGIDDLEPFAARDFARAIAGLEQR